MPFLVANLTRPAATPLAIALFCPSIEKSDVWSQWHVAQDVATPFPIQTNCAFLLANEPVVITTIPY